LGSDKAEAEAILKRHDGNLRRVFAELSNESIHQLKQGRAQSRWSR